MKIKFLVDVEVKDHNQAVVESYKAGQVVDLKEDSARHWLVREKAEVVKTRRGRPAKVQNGQVETAEPTEAAEAP